MIEAQRNRHQDPLIQEEFERVYGILPTKWTKYDANPVAQAPMTWGTFTQEYMRWHRTGDTVHVWLYILGTTAVGGAPRLYVDVPRVPAFASIENHIGGACLVRDGAGVYVSGIWTWVAATDQIAVLRHDSANFGLGTERGFMLQFEYEVKG